MQNLRAYAAGALVAMTLAVGACTQNTGKGAAIGAAAGAGLGALNGRGIISGAATGAVVGGAGGFIYDKVRHW